MIKRLAMQASPALASLTLALLLGGCVSLAPTYQRPAAPVAPAFPDAQAGTTSAASAPGATPAVNIEWQRFFSDERLKRLIALALENNRDLRIAVLNIEQARAAYDIRRADAWRTVTLPASAFKAETGDSLPGWEGVNQLEFRTERSDGPEPVYGPVRWVVP